MARNDQAMAALANTEAAILLELENLATIETALAVSEQSWLATPIIDHMNGGQIGSESWSYGAYLGFWNSRRNSVMETIDRLERMAEQLNKRIQAQAPPFRTQLIKVKL